MVLPRYKMRSEGEVVAIGDQIILACRKFHVYLHMSQKGSQTEVQSEIGNATQHAR